MDESPASARALAYSDELAAPTARCRRRTRLRQITYSGQGGSDPADRAAPGARATADDPLTSVDQRAKTEQLRRAADALARSELDPAIVQVNASLAAVHDLVLVLASDGMMGADAIDLVRFNVSVIAERDGAGARQCRRRWPRYDYATLLAGDGTCSRSTRRAMRCVRRCSTSTPLTFSVPGSMPGSCSGRTTTGVLLHEADGHVAGGDFVLGAPQPADPGGQVGLAAVHGHRARLRPIVLPLDQRGSTLIRKRVC